jgi:hypothetical protein
VLFASDVAVWNIAIQNSSATRFLAFNLAPALVGIIYVFLTRNQQLIFGLERHGIIWKLCWSVLSFLELDFDTAFYWPY